MDDPNRHSGPRPSIADEPALLDSLEELDRLLAAFNAPKAQKSQPSGPPAPPPPLPDLFLPARDTSPSKPSIRDGERPRAATPLSTATSATNVSTFETFYGFDEAPFSTAPDLKFLYHSDAYEHASQALLDSVVRRDRLVLVTGDTGIGKTLTCRAVVEQLDSRTLTSFISDASPGVDEILKTVLVDLGVVSRQDVLRGRLAITSRAELLATLGGFLESLQALEAAAMVIVDQAETLSTQDLDELARASAEFPGSRLQIVLVGSLGLASRLKRRELRSVAQRIAATIEVRPLVADEVPRYVAHRIGVAGARPRVEFDAAALARMFELSKGLPRRVNQIADEALRLGHDQLASVLDLPIVERVGARLELLPPRGPSPTAEFLLIVVFTAVMVLAGATAAAWVFQDDVSRVFAGWAGQPPAPRRPALPRLPPLQPKAAPADER